MRKEKERKGTRPSNSDFWLRHWSGPLREGTSGGKLPWATRRFNWGSHRRSKNIKYMKMRHLKNQKLSPQRGPRECFPWSRCGFRRACHRLQRRRRRHSLAASLSMQLSLQSATRTFADDSNGTSSPVPRLPLRTRFSYNIPSVVFRNVGYLRSLKRAKMLSERHLKRFCFFAGTPMAFNLPGTDGWVNLVSQ